MTSHVTLSKTNGTLLFKFLFKCLAALCVLDSVGASPTRQLSTATSSAQPPTISGVPSPCVFAGPVSPCTSPEELTLNLHPSPSLSRSLSSPLTTHHPFNLDLTLTLRSP
jgi:hypothetical protein